MQRWKLADIAVSCEVNYVTTTTELFCSQYPSLACSKLFQLANTDFVLIHHMIDVLTTSTLSELAENPAPMTFTPAVVSNAWPLWSRIHVFACSCSLRASPSHTSGRGYHHVGTGPRQLTGHFAHAASELCAQGF
jgi:hypothetical protein